MKEVNKSKEQLINELAKMRRRITKLEKLEKQRKRAEVELRNTKDYLDNVIESSLDGIAVSDSWGYILKVNKSFTKLAGREEKEIIGKHAMELSVTEEGTYESTTGELVEIDEEFFNHSIKTMTELYDEGKIFNWETYYLRKDGKVVPVEMNIVYLYSEEGEIIGSVGINRDITGRKRAEKDLKHTKNYLSNVINSMPSVLVSVDCEGRVTEWNLEAEKVTGSTKKEASGQPLDKVIPMFAKQMENISQCIRERKQQKVERILSNIEGETQYLDLMIYPLIVNEVEGAVIRVDDITSRVRIEDMMIQTEKMMSVGGLAAGMAHEINNPLGGILQGAQNIMRRIFHDLPKNIQVAHECGTDLEKIRSYMEKRQIAKFLEGIMTLGRTASRIVANMLEFSRESGNHMSLIPNNLADIIEKTVEIAANDYDLKKHYDFRHIEIVRDYDLDLPEVPCDANRIEQVILNLLKNAAQAMGKDRIQAPRIILRTRQFDKMARIEVEDNGPGIEEKNRKRIFEPFFTTKEVRVGTGLGLSVSYFIITENHKGTITVESSPGKGAKFIIHLPLERRSP
jgi:PAS domain S-box-containing protein